MSLSWCCEPLIGSLCFLILFVEGGGGGGGGGDGVLVSLV